MGSIYHWFDDLLAASALARWSAVVLILVATAVVARWIDARVTRSVERHARTRTYAAMSQLERRKRARTAASLSASLGRYVVVAVGVGIALAIVTHGALANGTFGGVVVGGTVLVVVIAFVLQRVLIDMVAGALLLFEGHVAVGDFIKTAQLDGMSGVVERIGLRATTLRSFNGDQHVIMNAALNGFTRVRAGFCDFELELFTVLDADATEMIEHVCDRMRRYEQNFFLRGPHLVAQRAIGQRDAQHVRIRAIVPPTLEWLCERALPAQLESELGDLLFGEIQVFNLDEASFAQYRAAVVLPERLEAPSRDTRRVEDRLRTGEAHDIDQRGAALAHLPSRRRSLRRPPS